MFDVVSCVHTHGTSLFMDVHFQMNKLTSTRKKSIEESIEEIPKCQRVYQNCFFIFMFLKCHCVD